MAQPLFGVSAVGYRLEGGFNGTGEPANQWSPWERANKVPLAPPGRGGIWSDPDRILDTASSVGAEAIALGVEWARIEPAPGRVDGDAVERYESIFASAASRGLEPIAVLHDVAHPGWLGEEFWLTPGSPDRFADHVARLAARLSPTCRHWVTTRQSNLVALAGWVDGRHPPRRVGALADAWAVVDNLLTAHVLAYEAIHDVQRDGVVLFGVRASSSYDWCELVVDLLCAPALGVGRDAIDGWVDTRRAGHVSSVPPRDLRDLAWRRLAAVTAPFGTSRSGPLRLRRPSPRRAVDVVYRFAGRDAPASAADGPPPPGRAYPLDALLLVWTSPPAGPAPGRAGRSVGPWARRPEPWALAEWCRRQARATPDLPLWVEDGLATYRGCPRADGWDLRSYLRAELEAVAGGTVAGYLSFEGAGDPTWPDAHFGTCRPGDDPGAAPGATPGGPPGTVDPDPR